MAVNARQFRAWTENVDMGPGIGVQAVTVLNYPPNKTNLVLVPQVSLGHEAIRRTRTHARIVMSVHT